MISDLLKGYFCPKFIVLFETDRRNDITGEKHGQKCFEHAR